MDIEFSSLWDQVTEVINSPTKPVHGYWEADVHANGLSVRALKVLNIDKVRDFENDYAATIMVDLMIPMGEYTYLIYPYQDTIEITLYRKPMHEEGASQNMQDSVQIQKFTAVLIDKGNPMMANNGANTPTREALDLTNIATATFQLISKPLEQLRLLKYGNTFRDTTVEDVLKSVMTTESQKIKVDTALLPKGVNIVPPSNKAKRKLIIIPQGIPLVDIPNFIHIRQGGVYSAGMGYFYENDYWYIYPCYDIERFKDADKTLTIISVPSNKLPQVERTYIRKGSSLIVLATGQVKFADDSTVQQLTKGNGVMFADASKFINGMGKVKGNKLMASRGAIMNEFIAIPRDNGQNFVPRSSAPISANPFVQFTQMARREGSVFAFVWENSEGGLIEPGMMTKILYLEEDDVKELHGVVLKAHEFTELHGQGISSSRHTTKTMVSIFTQRIVAT